MKNVADLQVNNSDAMSLAQKAVLPKNRAYCRQKFFHKRKGERGSFRYLSNSRQRVMTKQLTKMQLM